MKKLAIIIATIVLASTASAQIRSYGAVGIGVSLTKGEGSALAHFVGLDENILTDTVKGVRSFVRTVYYYENREDDVQAASLWSITEKALFSRPGGSILSLGGGFGALQQFQDEGDITNLQLKFELNWNIFNRVALSVGGDYIPRSGLADKAFIYAGFNLNP